MNLAIARDQRSIGTIHSARIEGLQGVAARFRKAPGDERDRALSREPRQRALDRCGQVVEPLRERALIGFGSKEGEVLRKNHELRAALGGAQNESAHLCEVLFEVVLARELDRRDPQASLHEGIT